MQSREYLKLLVPLFLNYLGRYRGYCANLEKLYANGFKEYSKPLSSLGYSFHLIFNFWCFISEAILLYLERKIVVSAAKKSLLVQNSRSDTFSPTSPLPLSLVRRRQGVRFRYIWCVTLQIYNHLQNCFKVLRTLHLKFNQLQN